MRRKHRRSSGWKPSKASSRLLKPFLGREWKALVVAAAATVVAVAAELASPFPLKFVIDHLFAQSEAGSFDLDSSDFTLLAIMGGFVLLIALADALASYWMDIELQRAGERIVHNLRGAVYSHLQSLSLSYHQRRHAGDLLTRVTGDVNAVGSLFSDSLGQVVASVLLLVGMLVVSVVMDPLVALAAFAVTPLLAWVTIRFRRRVRDLARQQRAKEGEIASLASESLSSMHAVKALGSEEFESDRVIRTSEERLEFGIQSSRVEGRFGGAVDVLGAVGTTLVMVVGVWQVARGVLSPGSLIVMSSYARKAYKPMRTLARHSTRISRAMARADRVAEVLAADEVMTDRPGAYRGPRAKGDVALDNVSFAYDPERPVLDDVSLDIPAGTRLAVVGRSGAGKSTLAALIARFHEPDAGRVLIDGRDSRDCALDWLRAQVGLVLQDTVLFSGTVAENIAYATEATREEVITAARTAGAHDFVTELPDTYDTALGPRGVSLSGGQRQRIALARTLLRDPAVLVLDEPTTGLDAEAEARVLQGLDVLMRGRTTLIITHALELAAKADRVVVVDEGRIVQDGTPRELLATDGLFQYLTAEQRGPDADTDEERIDELRMLFTRALTARSEARSTTAATGGEEPAAHNGQGAAADLSGPSEREASRPRRRDSGRRRRHKHRRGRR